MSNTVAKLNIHLGASTGALQRDFQQAEGIVQGFSQRFSGFASRMGTLVGGAALGFAGWGIKLAAEAETAKVSFEVMLGSADRAKKMLGDLSAFAESTPFGKAQLQDAAKTLLAFGIQGERILPTLQMLGDVSGGNAEKLSSLATVFGQIASAGKLTGGDLLQLINVGFNPLQVIAAKTGKSMAVLKDEMSRGQITFAMVESAFKSATSEGGLFFGMMDKQSQTLSGKLSTLVDQISGLALAFGEKLLPALKFVLEVGAGVLGWIKTLSSTTVTVTASVLGFGAAFTAFLMIAPRIVAGFRLLVAAYKMLTSAQVINLAMSGPKGWAVLAAGAIVAAGTVAAVAYAFSGITGEMSKAKQEAADASAKAKNGTDKIGDAADNAKKKYNAFGLEIGEMATQFDLSAGKVSQFQMTIESFAAKGKQITEQMRTPLETYVDTFAELQSMLEHGAISWETFGRASKKAGDELAAATTAKHQFEAPASVRVGAVTRFTTAGFSAVADAKDNSEKLRAVAQHQLEELKNIARMQAEANRLLERNGVKTTVMAIP